MQRVSGHVHPSPLGPPESAESVISVVALGGSSAIAFPVRSSAAGGTAAPRPRGKARASRYLLGRHVRRDALLAVAIWSPWRPRRSLSLEHPCNAVASTRRGGATTRAASPGSPGSRRRGAANVSVASRSEHARGERERRTPCAERRIRRKATPDRRPRRRCRARTSAHRHGTRVDLGTDRVHECGPAPIGRLPWRTAVVEMPRLRKGRPC